MYVRGNEANAGMEVGWLIDERIEHVQKVNDRYRMDCMATFVRPDSGQSR